ncbi:MAG: dihydroorotate dehydrogenase [Elusimicrobiota bacterium]
MNIKFGSIKMPAPYIAASGCYGYGFEMEDAITSAGHLKWGAVTTKTITLNPREGNPVPRIFEVPSGVINRIGLQNCGLDAFIKEKLPRIKKLPYPAIISIFGENSEEWLTLARILSRQSVRALELNLSCPNLKGEILSRKKEKCAEIIKKIKKETSVPVWVKINAVDSPSENAKIFKKTGADAIVCSNTIPACTVLKKKIYSGGLSGPAIKAVALKAVREISLNANIDLAACGGITSYHDIEDYRLCGARAFVLGTAALNRPDIVNLLSKQSKEKKGCTNL